MLKVALCTLIYKINKVINYYWRNNGFFSDQTFLCVIYLRPFPPLIFIFFFRVKLVEKEKDELEGPMREAVGWLSLSNEKAKLENKKLQGEIKNLQRNIGYVFSSEPTI